MTHKKNRKFYLISIMLSAVLLVGIFPVAVSAASCANCGVDSDYTVGYEYWTDTYHTIRHWCDNCGKDQNMGGAASEHTFSHYSSSYDVCDDCGYQIACECGEGDGGGDGGEDTECTHDDYYTEWDGCDWYDYCEYCDELLDSGTSHGDYEYEDWEYYTKTRHRRLYACVDCGEGEYEYEYHDTEDEYLYSDIYEHEIASYCADCDEYIGDSTYEEHSFSYDIWISSDDTRHSRYYCCRYCIYDNTDYEDHEYTTECNSDNEYEHITTYSCDVCGHSYPEYESHYDSDSDGECDKCGYTASRFSVTVPALLTLTVAEDGTVYAAVSAMIVNNSSGEITVTSITLNTENGWTLVPFETNMADEKVNTKLIGFRINGSESTVDGDSEALTLYDEWTIGTESTLSLDYDAVVSAVSEPIDEQVLTIVFIVGWAA